jgi:hypothetical protein
MHDDILFCLREWKIKKPFSALRANSVADKHRVQQQRSAGGSRESDLIVTSGAVVAVIRSANS